MNNITMAMAASGEYITQLHKCDVLMGRGSGANERFGNMYFRDLVASRKTEYLAVSPRDAINKNRIAREIIDTIRSQGGRFLRRVVEADGSCSKIRYALAEESKVMEKAKMALRQQNNTNTSASETTVGATATAAPKTAPSIANGHLTSHHKTPQAAIPSAPSAVASAYQDYTQQRTQPAMQQPVQQPNQKDMAQIKQAAEEQQQLLRQLQQFASSNSDAGMASLPSAGVTTAGDAQVQRLQQEQHMQQLQLHHQQQQLLLRQQEQIRQQYLLRQAAQHNQSSFPKQPPNMMMNERVGGVTNNNQTQTMALLQYEQEAARQRQQRFLQQQQQALQQYEQAAKDERAAKERLAQSNIIRVATSEISSNISGLGTNVNNRGGQYHGPSSRNIEVENYARKFEEQVGVRGGRAVASMMQPGGEISVDISPRGNTNKSIASFDGLSLPESQVRALESTFARGNVDDFSVSAPSLSESQMEALERAFAGGAASGSMSVSASAASQHFKPAALGASGGESISLLSQRLDNASHASHHRSLMDEIEGLSLPSGSIGEISEFGMHQSASRRSAGSISELSAFGGMSRSRLDGLSLGATSTIFEGALQREGGEDVTMAGISHAVGSRTRADNGNQRVSFGGEQYTTHEAASVLQSLSSAPCPSHSGQESANDNNMAFAQPMVPNPREHEETSVQRRKRQSLCQESANDNNMAVAQPMVPNPSEHEETSAQRRKRQSLSSYFRVHLDRMEEG